jgi:hypothetical protein
MRSLPTIRYFRIQHFDFDKREDLIDEIATNDKVLQNLNSDFDEREELIDEFAINEKVLPHLNSNFDKRDGKTTCVNFQPRYSR